MMNIKQNDTGNGEVTPYVYVIVRKDLSKEQQVIQASHAALEAGCRFKKDERIAHLVLLEVENEDRLSMVGEKLLDSGVDFHMFFEPDDAMGYSAIATAPLSGRERRIFRGFKMFRSCGGDR